MLGDLRVRPETERDPQMINEDQSKQLERKLKDLMDRTEILEQREPNFST